MLIAENVHAKRLLDLLNVASCLKLLAFLFKYMKNFFNKILVNNVLDAIPARKAQTVSYQRAKQQLQHSEEEEENEDPSPKSNHSKRKAGWVT